MASTQQLPRVRLSGHRGLLFTLLAVLCVAVAGVYVAWAMVRGDSGSGSTVAPSANLTIAEHAVPAILFQHLAAQPDSVGFTPLTEPDGPRVIAPLRCARLHFAAGRGLCLHVDEGFGAAPVAYVFGPDFAVQHELGLNGFPSRARVSPDGRYGATTTFVAGHSYAETGFSTETVLFDLASGASLGNLEDFVVERDGERITAPDVNFWGVTFANASDRFYATLATGGQTYLVEGDVAARRLRVLRENVECPSLSPDNTRLVFKKRVNGDMGAPVWRFHVLDLASMAETPLAEERSIDDQVEWLNDEQIVYGELGSLWTVPADGSGEPRRFMTQASSPAVVRGALASPAEHPEEVALTPTDLAIDVSRSTDQVEAGQPLTYTLTIANQGPVDATQLRVDHVLTMDAAIGVPESADPPSTGYGCAVRGEELRVTCDTALLPSGASWTIQFSVTPAAPGTLESRSMVSGAQPDANPGNDSATTETRVR